MLVTSQDLRVEKTFKTMIKDKKKKKKAFVSKDSHKNAI